MSEKEEENVDPYMPRIGDKILIEVVDVAEDGSPQINTQIQGYHPALLGVVMGVLDNDPNMARVLMEGCQKYALYKLSELEESAEKVAEEMERDSKDEIDPNLFSWKGGNA